MTPILYLIPVRMAMIKNTITVHAGEGIEQGEHSSIADESTNLYDHFGNECQFL